MAGTAADRGTEHARARSMETNTYSGGKRGSKVPITKGPAYGGGLGGNKTKGGGITRPVRGLG